MSALFLLSLLVVAAAAAVPMTLVEKSTFASHAEPAGWRDVGDASESQLHSLTVALKLRNVDLLERALAQTSDPESPLYGQHWSKERVDATCAPAAESLRVVREWLRAAFGASVHLDESFHGYIDVVVPIAAAERALDADFRLFAHKKAPGTLARTHRYSLPAHVVPHVDFVAGTVRFPSTRAKFITDTPRLREIKAAVPRDPNWPSLGIVPDTILSRYDLYNYKPAKLTKQSIAQFLGQAWSPIDLEEYYTLFAQSCIGHCEPYETIGPNAWYDPGVESNLDVQTITAVSKGLPTLVFSNETMRNGQEPFFRFMLQLLNLSTTAQPDVVSISYGDDEDSLSLAFMTRVTTEFMKAGLRGITMLCAAGDSGASCQDNGNEFEPAFPASSPYITTVGGTDAEDFETGEEVLNSIGGSGFSNVFAQPAWQKSAVANWLAQAGSAAPAPHYYNVTGRAYPDVAAFSNAFWIVTDLVPSPVSGTSCASPTMAAVIASLNDYRASNKLPSLGFLNPALYAAGAKNPQIFNGIKTGANLGCDSNNGIGFSTLPSGTWSPASGWGSVKFRAAQSVLGK